MSDTNELLDDGLLGIDPNSTQYKLIKYDLEDAEERILKSRNILFFLSALTIGVALYLKSKGQLFFDVIFFANIILGIIYLIAGLLTKKFPIPAFATAIAFYVGIQIMAIIGDPNTILQGIVFKLVIIIGLVVGLINAVKSEKIKKRLKIK